ncbi:MAG: DUF1501 domain-containing protein [Alphaproteobacteria bacterium]|nr:DUF1501 domain-containing protein [Alphaproteobacteria bacterium]
MRTRRDLLLGGAALGGGLLLPGTSPIVAAAAPPAPVSPEYRKFVFVWVHGGWDPTKVFMDSFDDRIVAGRTPGSDGVGTSDLRASYGDLHLVANPRRPSVDRFFSAHHERVAVVDGMLIRSINHPICSTLWMTGTPNAARPDWPSTIAAASASRYSVPHIIVSGYSMAGDYSAYTVYSGREGTLQQLLTGTSNFAIGADEGHPPPRLELQAAMDEYLAERAAERATGASTPIEGRLTEAYRQASERLIAFKDDTRRLDLDGGHDLRTQIPLAMTLLSSDVTRCVTLKHGNFEWDSHTENLEQDPLFEDLFSCLDLLVRSLDATPGTRASTLAEETVVVVFSEMGRTPFLNSTGGKDHWMYTSCMFFGAGIRGGRQLGGYTDTLNGETVSLETGDVVPGGAGTAITPDVIGSTLLTLAGVDPVDELGADTTLRGLLS